MAYYSRRHYRLVSPPKDTDLEIEQRRILKEVLEQVARERAERWPGGVTSFEVGDAMARWQEERITELRKERGI